MAKPSLKNVSTAEIEAAIAQTLIALTGWETCSVSIGAVDFEKPFTGGEAVNLKLGVEFSSEHVGRSELDSMDDDTPLG